MIVNSQFVPIYAGYAVASTNYVYNDSGAVLSTSGWINARYDNVAIEYEVATLTATYLSIRVEGKIGNSRAFKINDTNIATVNQYSDVIAISYPVDQIRVGIKANSATVPNSFYCGLIGTESK